MLGVNQLKNGTILVVITLFLIIGCTRIQKYNTKQKYDFDVPQAPIIDYGLIQGKVLNVTKVNGLDVAKIEVLKIINYTRNPKSNYSILKIGDILDFQFQWGVTSKIIDGPPMNDPQGDIILPGTKEGDKIQAEVNNQFGWRVYRYEII